jgi:hypothetical protein
MEDAVRYYFFVVGANNSSRITVTALPGFYVYHSEPIVRGTACLFKELQRWSLP